MNAMTTPPATGTGNSTDANSAAPQNAAGEFNQLIAELLGDASPTPDTPKPLVAMAASSSDTATSDTDKPAAAADAALTPEMLALAYPLAYPVAYVPPPASPTTAAVADDGSMNAIAGGARNASADAALMQQLAQLVAQSDKNTAGVATGATVNQSTTGAATESGISTDQINDRSAFNALFAQTNAMLSLSPDKRGELGDKLKDSDDGTVPVQSAGTYNNTYDQLQQAGLTPVRYQDAAVNEQSPQYTIHAHVGSREWSTELGNRLTMMTTHNTQSASLQLTPDNLGPVQVKIDINHNQASVWFTADQADTRAALEQSLPKLRELFAAQGMSLTDAGVFGQRSQQQQQSFSNDGRATARESNSVEAVTSSRTLISSGLLDTYV